MNEIIDPNNNKLFYSTKLKEFISVVLHSYSFIADQPRKWHYTNHAGGNSEYGRVQGYSCNVKDMYLNLLSYKECKK